MATVAVYNTEGMEVETIELDDNIFGVEINETLVHKAVVTYLANNRQGTQSAKTRSEVSGGGKKPWRQKGTGHARQGSTRSPQWTGGGVVFAPKPRDYSMKMNKREKQIALFSALSSKVAEKQIIVVDQISFAAPKTAEFVKVMKNLKAEAAYIVTKDVNENLVLSARNVEGVATTISSSINVYDILNHGSLVITKDAVKAIEEVYA